MNARVNPHDLWIMLLGYVRYSMGRMSSAPSHARGLVRAYGQHVEPAQLEQIRREVAEELATYERMGKTLGHDCDHKTWRGVVEDIEARQAEAATPTGGKP